MADMSIFVICLKAEKIETGFNGIEYKVFIVIL